jgi:hypothetical protein
MSFQESVEVTAQGGLHLTSTSELMANRITKREFPPQTQNHHQQTQQTQYATQDGPIEDMSVGATEQPTQTLQQTPQMQNVTAPMSAHSATQVLADLSVLANQSHGIFLYFTIGICAVHV